MSKTKSNGQTAVHASDKTENTAQKKITAKDIDLNQYVTVRNGFQGKLVYKSARTGEKYVWDSFGAEQEMELRELRDAKNTSKGFFTNNWFMFDDDWVVDFLGVRNFYKNAIRIEDFDAIFSKSPADLKAAISEMSAGQKRSVAYRAVELIACGEIDSRKTISALEESLGMELIEK